MIPTQNRYSACPAPSRPRGGPFYAPLGLMAVQDAGVWLTIQRMP